MLNIVVSAMVGLYKEKERINTSNFLIIIVTNIY